MFAFAWLVCLVWFGGVLLYTFSLGLVCVVCGVALAIVGVCLLDYAFALRFTCAYCGCNGCLGVILLFGLVCVSLLWFSGLLVLIVCVLRWFG